MPERWAIWTAVSTKVQSREDRHSLPIQERDGKTFVEDAGGVVVDVMRVPGHSRRYKDFNLLSQAAQRKGIDAFTKLEQHWKAKDLDHIWVRGGDRFARTQSLHARIVEELIDAGITIYAQDDGGWVDKSNYRYWIAMSGAKAAGHVDTLVMAGKRTKDSKAALGLLVNAKPLWSHKVMRNDLGKITALVPDRSKALIIEDAARLVVEGVGWTRLEAQLTERFGHTNGGRKFRSGFFYRLFHNPTFWGHAARRWNDAHTPNGQRTDLWVFDPTIPPPEGALIYYNVYAPALDGDLAAQLQAELRRRRSAIRGSARPNSAHRFAGLLVCGHCGYRMVYGQNGSDEPIYRCPTKWAPYIKSECIGQNVREDYIIAWVSSRLRRMIELGTPDVFDDIGLSSSSEPSAAALEARLIEVQAKARRLIDKQTAADSALTALYDEQLAQCAAEIKSLQQRIRDSGRRADEQARTERQRAVNEMSVEGFLDDLWQRPEVEVNQFLHRIMTKRRFVLANREFVRAIEV